MQETGGGRGGEGLVPKKRTDYHHLGVSENTTQRGKKRKSDLEVKAEQSRYPEPKLHR